MAARLNADLPALLDGAPWAFVSACLAGQTATWLWNAPHPARDAGGPIDPALTPERVAADTVLRWGSLAKPVTALMVLRLVALGKLGLDDRAVARSASFAPSRRQGRGLGAGRITIRHLLTHTSGMGVARYAGIDWDSRRPRAADLLSSDRPPHRWSLAHGPGTAFTYGSAAYLWLQSIIEDLTGEPFERAARSLLLDPLELPDVAFLGDGPAPGPIAWGLGEDQRAISPRRSPAPAATGLFAPPGDVTRLLGGLVSPGSPLERLLGAELLASSLENHTPFATEAWGLGWRLQESDDGPVFRHAGWPDGCTAYVEGVPRLGLITCLQIGRSGARRALARIAQIARWHARQPETPVLGEDQPPSASGVARPVD